MGKHLNTIPKKVREELGLAKPPNFNQFWAIIGNSSPIFFRSSWEFYYGIFLEKLKREGKIKDWRHEPKTFWFNEVKRGIRSYLPDYCITHLNDSEEWAEVKGYEDAASMTKMKRMAQFYPEVKIRLVGASWFKVNLKDCKELEFVYSKRIAPPR